MALVFDEVGGHQNKDIFLRENKKSLTKTMSLLTELMHPAVIPYKTVFTLQQLL